VSQENKRVWHKIIHSIRGAFCDDALYKLTFTFTYMTENDNIAGINIAKLAYIKATLIACRNQLTWTTTQLNRSATMPCHCGVRELRLLKRCKPLAHQLQDFSIHASTHIWTWLHAMRRTESVLAELQYRCTNFLSWSRCLTYFIHRSFSDSQSLMG